DEPRFRRHALVRASKPAELFRLLRSPIRWMSKSTIRRLETMVKQSRAWLQRVLVLALASGLLSGGIASPPGRKLPRTVVDYFLLLPDRYFEPGDRRELLGPLHGPLIDVKNGYISFEGDGAQQDLDVCLFRRPDGSFLVAVSNNKAPDRVW